jgi:hypothetical protein
MSEDRKLARQMAAADHKAVTTEMRQQFGDRVVFSSYDEHGIDAVSVDSDKVLVTLTIGTRGDLTKTRARAAAAAWRELTARYPESVFVINFHGYNNDPREIWEIVDAARYVRRFARAAGLDDFEAADRWLGSGSPGAHIPQIGGGLGFLAACGVFGDELKQVALRAHKPTLKQ